MRNNIVKMLLVCIVVVFKAVLVVKAQPVSYTPPYSKLTNKLSIIEQDLMAALEPYTDYSGGNQIPTTKFPFPTFRFKAAEGDCFLITAQFTAADFDLSTGSRKTVFQFYAHGADPLFGVGVIKKSDTEFRWYVARPTRLANIGKSVDLYYEIYDNLGIEGNFTFIFSKFSTFIAVDTEGPITYLNRFKLAPLFFGIESNAGYYESNMEHFTRIAVSDNDATAIRILKPCHIWKLPFSRGIKDVISSLQGKNDPIVNRAAIPVSAGKVLAPVIYEPAIAGVKLYPNPTNGRFNLDFSLKNAGPVTVKISTLTGLQVYEQRNKPYPKGNNRFTFDRTNRLPKGVYIVRVSSAEFSEAVKLVVE